MPPSRVEVIIHPVRLRILMAVAGREMTPQQLAAALPDIPQATLYRHINTLHKAGVLRVVRETPMRGAVERVYELVQEASLIPKEEWAQIAPADHLRYFTQFSANLLNLARLYLQQAEVPLDKDLFWYRTTILQLSEADSAAFRQALLELIQEFATRRAAPGSKRAYFTTIAIPEGGDGS
jgi:DNA-binding transcriptional ArsR family regulator